MYLSYDPEIPILNIYPKEKKMCLQKRRVIIRVLFIIAKAGSKGN